MLIFRRKSRNSTILRARKIVELRLFLNVRWFMPSVLCDTMRGGWLLIDCRSYVIDMVYAHLQENITCLIWTKYVLIFRLFPRIPFILIIPVVLRLRGKCWNACNSICTIPMPITVGSFAPDGNPMQRWPRRGWL